MEAQRYQRHIWHKYQYAGKQIEEGIWQETVEDLQYRVTFRLHGEEVISRCIKSAPPYGHIDKENDKRYYQYSDHYPGKVPELRSV